METIKNGLTFYAYIKTFGFIFFGIILLVCAIAFLFYIINNNYQKAKNSKVDYYNITNLNKCNDDEVKKNLCKLQLEYTDGSNVYKYDTEPNRKVGNTSVFYQQENPKSYMVTPSPYIFPGIVSCFACIILTISIIRLIIMRSKDGAAAVGVFDVASSLFSGNGNNIPYQSISPFTIHL